ncbi:MAG: DUF4113 domain-containing protein [Candidatus Competibacteraceae bacterium]|nr:DUF4113 domain-containing protein [Candidatus Competibacteraceae bacterium]
MMLYQPGQRYQGAGVMLMDLSPTDQAQGDCWTAWADERTARRLAVLDHINARWGAGTLRLAREGFQQPWAMRQENWSLAYTTHWENLPVVQTDGSTRLAMRPGAFSAVYSIPRSARDTACVPPITR